MMCRKAFYSVGITEEILVEFNYGTEIIIWSEATDSENCSFGTELLCSQRNQSPLHSQWKELQSQIPEADVSPLPH